MEKKLLIILIATLAILGVFSIAYVAINDDAKVPIEDPTDVIKPSYEMIDEEKGDMSLISKTFDFTYNEKKWHIEASVPQYRYDNYVKEKYVVYRTDLYGYEPTEQRAYIKDEYLQDVVDQIKTQNGKLTNNELVEVLTYFVQSQISYESDEVQYGQDYLAYPMQALINGKGDCDCKTILLIGLLYHAGFECVYISISLDDSSFGHTLVGISSNDIVGTDQWRYLQHNGKKYYIIESTSVLPIGTYTYSDEELYKLRTIHEYGKRTIFEYDEVLAMNDYLKNSA